MLMTVRRAAARASRTLLRPLGLVRVPANRLGVDLCFDLRSLSRRLYGSPSLVRTIVDVGANTGYFAKDLLDVFSHARLIAFEPHPDTFARLQQRLGRNPRATLVPSALGMAPGHAQLMQLPESAWNTLHPDSRFVRRYSLSGPTRTVPVDTLDRYCAEHHIDRIDLLKIDTEGSDLDVLRGAIGLLGRRAVRFVYIEFNDLLADPKAHGGTLADFELLLRPFGFRYITTYTESIHPVPPLFLVANALFALEPEPAA